MKENKCVECGKEVGNDVFTTCDDCWPVVKVRQRPYVSLEKYDALEQEMNNYKIQAYEQLIEIEELKAGIEKFVNDWVDDCESVSKLEDLLKP